MPDADDISSDGCQISSLLVNEDPGSRIPDPGSCPTVFAHNRHYYRPSLLNLTSSEPLRKHSHDQSGIVATNPIEISNMSATTSFQLLISAIFLGALNSDGTV